MSTAPEAQATYWRRCNTCKKEIPYRSKYWVCNVSTCNRKRTGLVFCGVSCWDAHVPMMNHRESWAEERKAPTLEEWQKTLAGEDKPEPRKTQPKAEAAAAPASATAAQTAPKVVLRKPRAE